MSLSPAMDATLPQTQPTQEEIDNAIQLTQISSDIGLGKKSQKALSDETEKLLAEASAALENKPEALKKPEAKAEEEEVPAKDFEV